MTDTEVIKTSQMENMDDTNYIGDVSSSSKESDVENVDAIKKYIEEQEILIRNSSQANEFGSLEKTENPVRVTKNDCILLEQQLALSEESEIGFKNLRLQNPAVTLSPSSIKSVKKDFEESVISEEHGKSHSETTFISGFVTELRNKDNFVNQTEPILSLQKQSISSSHIDIVLQQSCDRLQANIHSSELTYKKNILKEEDTKFQDRNSCETIKDDSKLILDNKYSDLHCLKTDQIVNKLGSPESKGKVTLSEFPEKRSEDIDESKLLQQLLISTDAFDNEMRKTGEFKCKNILNTEQSEETLAIATSVLDMILTDTEAAVNKKKLCISPKKGNKDLSFCHCYINFKERCLKFLFKQIHSLKFDDCWEEAVVLIRKFQKKITKVTVESYRIQLVNNCVSLAIGSKVEAKDFSELWYPAKIVELDCEEMEVLVQYDDQPKKHNEWISISSPRLRSITDYEPRPMLSANSVSTAARECVPECKAEEKRKVSFAVGERCLARWRDNRRFIATVQTDLGNGSYEVMFDDGFQWKCTLSRLYKLKESNKHEYPNFNTRVSQLPAQDQAPCTLAAAAPLANGMARVPVYHTHLFDPTRDYLGSKSERREMKRKLNIKEIFNIGQKRKKTSIVDRLTKRTPVFPNSAEKVKFEDGSWPLITEATASPVEPPMKPITDLDIKCPVKKKLGVRKKPFVRKKIKLKMKTKKDVPFLNEGKNELPDAVAAIIGTVCKPEPLNDELNTEPAAGETKDSNANDITLDEQVPDKLGKFVDTTQTLEPVDTVIKEENQVENYEVHNHVKHEEVIDKIKEVITKLEDGINKVEHIELKPLEAKETVVNDVQSVVKSIRFVSKEKPKKASQVKKGKKLRLMQEKKVKKQVEKVKCQLEEMKKQVEAMRQQIMLKTEELESSRQGAGTAGEGGLLPGEWACRWVDGQPAGAVSEVECDARAEAPAKPPLPRRSVQVVDNRLPPGWTKHMVRRSLGHSAGKWDVVLVSPENRRIHTKNDMRIFLENNPDESRKPYEAALLDFGIHLKLARRLGWVASSADGAPPPPPPSREPSASSPLVKRARPPRALRVAARARRRDFNANPPTPVTSSVTSNVAPLAVEDDCVDPMTEDASLDGATIKDGFVHVGSLKVQVIETLLRCPAEECSKNFRNTMLLKMHIKHYHRELRKMMGVTPKVLDLAYARTRPTEAEMKRLNCEAQQRIIKVKLPRLHKRPEGPILERKEVMTETSSDLQPSISPIPEETIPKPQDSPKLRNALVNKPAKRPKVLLPVHIQETEAICDTDTFNNIDIKEEIIDSEEKELEPKLEVPDSAVLDYETAISTHTVSRLVVGASKCAGGARGARRKRFALIARDASSEEWGSSEPDSCSSYCGSPDSRRTDLMPPLSPDSNEEQAHNAYMFTENGERIKLVHMKREEIINCHCGFREEDGLMVQCELCLCWQHALCHNIQREAEVPEKYTCSICLNPRRGRRRQRYLHDQDRLFEGLLPAGTAGRPSEPLRRAHELAGNLLRAADALHAVRVNTHVATRKNHPKLYLWAKDWETVELTCAREKLNSEYSDLNVIISNLGKENMPIKIEDIKEIALNMKSQSQQSPEQTEEKNTKKENHIQTHTLLSGRMSSPGGVSLDLPISELEFEKLAKSVQGEQGLKARATAAPQPEKAIENSACRARLLRHVQRCHALLDQRLDSLEAHVAELESQDPSLEDDETAAFYPRTKQTMQMMLRDLDAMEELGQVT